MSGYLGSYLGLSEGSDAVLPPPGPDPIPVTDTIGTVIEPIDIAAHALDRLCEFLRP